MMEKELDWMGASAITQSLTYMLISQLYYKWNLSKYLENCKNNTHS